MTKPIRNYSLSNVFLTKRFFHLFGGFILLSIGAHFMTEAVFGMVKWLFCLFIGLSFLDLIILYIYKHPLGAKRSFATKVLSLGDKNLLWTEVESKSKIKYRFEFVDELPIEFQLVDFSIKSSLREDKFRLEYFLEPKERGLFHFGKLHFFLSSTLGLVQRRYSIEQSKEMQVFPSIYQMKKFSLLSLKKIQTELGLKKIRKLGHSYDFEQIKNYVPGDDIRSINWKATSRMNTMMVNHYQDEKSQQVYFLIDKSRPMNMPFGGLSLVDYAINSSLVLSNIALQKQDKAGLISFSDKIGSTLKADNKSGQMRKIMNALYNERYRNTEANYELLYQISRKLISRRSLIFLFSNFETMVALERALPNIRRINKNHLLVLIIFENTEIKKILETEVRNTKDIYLKTVATNYILEKQNMIQTLRNYGIQTVFTSPENLTINSINKYLELKARGLI